MLAYVFWHWRRADVDAARYESLQRRFHQALAADPPSGFVRSRSVALSGAPWANAGAECYEDWYFVRDSASLDPLNEGAITAARRQPHDAAAAVAAGGTAGLYRVRVGDATSIPRVAHWFAKPDGMSYDALFAAIKPLAAAGRGTLWVRQMVLGPSPELCLRTAEPVHLPPELAGLTVTLRPVYPEG